MLKKTIYPKTQRTTGQNAIVITEKVDGSNLSIFKKGGELYIAQRNYIFSLTEIEEVKDKLYKGLYGWLQQHAETLKASLHDNSVLCGEWISTGHIKYGQAFDNKKFLLFAKANVNDNFELFNINYYQDLFVYPFIDKTIPDFIGVVPLVDKRNGYPSIAELDYNYDKYKEQVNRDVEGFIINSGNSVTKYVRMKSGKLSEHTI